MNERRHGGSVDNCLERVRQQFAGDEGIKRFYSKYAGEITEFLDTYHFEAEEVENYTRLYATCFGKEGYLTSADEELVCRAWFLATFSHARLYRKRPGEIQMRGTGERYINHCLGSASLYAERNWVPANVVAGQLCHDTIEDTFLEEEDIGNFLGEPVRQYVERLSKVKGTQKKVMDRTQTLMQLFDPLMAGEIEAVMANAGKIYDVLHNCRTLAGKKNPADRYSLALHYLEVFAPLARFMGLTPEAQEIENLCFQVIGPQLYGEEYMYQLKQGKNRLDALDVREVEADVNDVLSKIPSKRIRPVIVKKPTLFELHRQVKDRKNMTDQDLFLQVELVLPDDDPRQFALASHYVAGWLNTDPRFSPPADGNVGYTNALAKVAHEQFTIGSHLDYVFDYASDTFPQTALHLKVLSASEHALEILPLTVLGAVTGSFGPQSIITGQKKLRGICTDMTALREQVGDDEFVRQVCNSLPDGISVAGLEEYEGHQEYRRRPIARGATVLDYVITAFPDRWQALEHVTVRRAGKKIKIKDLGMLLENEDVVQIKCGDSSNNQVMPLWLDAVAVDVDNSRAKIIAKIKERLANEQEREEYLGYVRDYGWLEVAKGFGGNLSKIGARWDVLESIDPRIKAMGSRNFAQAVCLGEIPRDTIETVAEGLRNHWEGLTVIVVRTDEKVGRLSQVTGIIAQAEINIAHLETSSKWGDTARITFRIDPRDPNFSKLEEVIRQIRAVVDPENTNPQERWVQRFSSNTAHSEWLTRYEKRVFEGSRP